MKEPRWKKPGFNISKFALTNRIFIIAVLIFLGLSLFNSHFLFTAINFFNYTVGLVFGVFLVVLGNLQIAPGKQPVFNLPQAAYTFVIYVGYLIIAVSFVTLLVLTWST